LIKQLFIQLQNSKVMKNEMISTSSFLDILFHNRNKQYGAYQLRKGYPKRLKKALLTTVLVSVSLVFLLASFKTKEKKNPVIIDIPGPILKPPTPEEPKDKPKVEPKKDIPKGNNVPVKKATPQSIPILVDDDVPVNLPPTNDDDGSSSGNTNDPNAASGGLGMGNPKGKDTVAVVIPEPPVKVDSFAIINEPDIDAHYPGGKEALAQYFQDKLGDEVMEDGISKKVTISFVVEMDGKVSDIKIISGTDSDFNKSAEKAVAKMKKWNPAKYQKRFVRTFHEMPITILPNE
jgi:periplasmic protein TonB